MRALAILAALTSTAHAHPMGNGGVCGTAEPESVVYDPTRVRAAPTTLFINRCVGGCMITKGSHDAPNNVSNNPNTGAGPFRIPEFTSFAGELGAPADDQWNQIVACVGSIYSFYNVNVVDTRPASGPYHMAVAAGTATAIQYTGDGNVLLGLSALSCAGPVDNVVSFALAETHRALFNNAPRYVKEMCNTIVHEAGHAFGLEHAFRFEDGTSACNDPMSYDTGVCSPPRRFFRNQEARCGTFELAPCSCGETQSSHAKLAASFGSKPSTIADPTAEVTSTGAQPGILGSVITGRAGSDRGVASVALVMNGYVFATQGGAPYIGEIGQPRYSQYLFTTPVDLPSSIYDVQYRACDDLGTCTDSPVFSVTKGGEGGCETAEECDTHQDCLEGRCTFRSPALQVGEACDISPQCVSDLCGTNARICTQPCSVAEDTCPADLECRAPFDETIGLCYVPREDDGGCCSTHDSAPWGACVLALGLAGLVRRRRAWRLRSRRSVRRPGASPARSGGLPSYRRAARRRRSGACGSRRGHR